MKPPVESRKEVRNYDDELDAKVEAVEGRLCLSPRRVVQRANDKVGSGAKDGARGKQDRSKRDQAEFSPEVADAEPIDGRSPGYQGSG